MGAPTGTVILEQSLVEHGNVLLTKVAGFLEVGCNQMAKASQRPDRRTRWQILSG